MTPDRWDWKPAWLKEKSSNPASPGTLVRNADLQASHQALVQSSLLGSNQPSRSFCSHCSLITTQIGEGLSEYPRVSPRPAHSPQATPPPSSSGGALDFYFTYHNTLDRVLPLNNTLETTGIHLWKPMVRGSERLLGVPASLTAHMIPVKWLWHCQQRKNWSVSQPLVTVVLHSHQAPRERMCKSEREFCFSNYNEEHKK